MFNKLDLGVVYNTDGIIINHRSLVKVLFNPFLRILGIQIATKYNKDTNTLLTPVIIKCGKVKCINFTYKNDIIYSIQKKRTLV